MFSVGGVSEKSVSIQKFCLVVLALAAGSCTSLLKEDCQTMNVYDHGQSDALQGRPLDSFTASLASCDRCGAIIDPADYAKGWEDGVRTFCTYEYGQRYGRSGEFYRGICPQEDEFDFLKGYYEGKREYQIDQKRLVQQEQEARFRSR